MTIAHAFSSPAAAAPRWWLFASLALNLFFAGLVVSLLVREPAQQQLDRSVSARIERLAATLPSADAQILRAEFNANRANIEGARGEYENARDGIRTVLRQEPYDQAAMGEAMAKTRTARQDFDRVLQAMVAKAAGDMSPAGRQKLADYAPSRPAGVRQ
jgi:uncharacterized membrane protein